MPHSSEWQAAFAAERGRLQALLGTLASAIEHVGSTAVADLPAKPIIDIAVAANLAATFDRINSILLANEYIYMKDAGNDGGHIFVREPYADVRTHHLHLIDADDAQWANYLSFRDLLRNDAGIRQRYAELKAALAAEFYDDREAYTAAKTEFIAEVLGASRV